jgi:hypothetical protein
MMPLSPKDWSPELERELRDGAMTIKFHEKMHNISHYNDDNGHGLTACGLRVGPWDTTWAGQFDCLTCISAARKERGGS